MINLTCRCIGTKDDERRHPPEAIEAVKTTLQEHTKHCVPADWRDNPAQTNIHAWLLESGRVAAKDPGDQTYTCLTQGGPAGILDSPVDTGIVPDCSASASASDTCAIPTFVSGSSAGTSTRSPARANIRSAALKAHRRFTASSLARSSSGQRCTHTAACLGTTTTRARRRHRESSAPRVYG